MTIIVLRNQNGWEERRGTCSSQPSASGVTALSIPTRVSVTLLKRTRAGAREVASVQIRVGSGRVHRCKFLVRKNLARIQSQSAAPSPLRSVIAAESSPGGGVTAGSLLPFWRGSRLFLNFFGAFKALRSLTSLHRGSALFQSSERGAAPDFHSLVLSAGLTGLAASVGRTPTSQKEIRKCPKSSWRNPK